MPTSLPSSTLLSFYTADSDLAIDVNDLKRELETGDDDRRVLAMQSILSAMVNGDPAVHSLLMYIIRFIVPSKNKTLKRLLLLYLENVNKLDENGSLKQEMILVWYDAVCLFIVMH